jgi:putative transposase
MGCIQAIFIFLKADVWSQAELAAENLALRQQLAILDQKSKRTRLRTHDRIFWVWLSRLWSGWSSAST